MGADKNGELDTSEFRVTCLKLLLDRRGDAASGEEGFGEGFIGEPVGSRLLIWSGDHPLAEDEMMLLRATFEAVLGDGCRRRRCAGDVGVGEVDMAKI